MRGDSYGIGYPAHRRRRAGPVAAGLVLGGSGCDLVVAMGREGKQALRFDPERAPYTAAMAAKLQTDECKAGYRRRKWIAEPPNGWIWNVLGFRQFSLRGLHGVRAEWMIVYLALNLRRMAAMQVPTGAHGAWRSGWRATTELATTRPAANAARRNRI